MDPFAALGLPARPDLTDEQVRAAWRAIAAATHPDRPDGGDVTRYTAATAAYAQLRTPWARSEAYADLNPITPDLTADQPATPPLPAIPAADLALSALPARAPGARAAHLACAALLLPARVRRGRPLARAVLLPARIRRGRPLRFILRAITAAFLSWLVLRIIPGQPSAPAAVTGIITWFVLTGRADPAPPPDS